MTTKAEENYIKAIYKIADRDGRAVATNAIASQMQTSAASVTDMIKRLSEKKLVNYQKYRGVTLSDIGRALATDLVRKHRLWEAFLVDKLHFKWNEIHDIAEELEHIDSSELINRLDAFLDFPRFDPHGDPIPSIDGKFTLRNQVILAELEAGITATVVGVRAHEDSFLAHLDDIGLSLSRKVEVLEKYRYDDSLLIEIEGTRRTISSKVAGNIYVKL
jgi:DtxR family transcriptional regulator, Mn-dependent transcriptional regulator